MNIFKLLSISLLLFTSTISVANDKDESIKIIESIVGECEKNGMLSCESRVKGIEIPFNYIRLFNILSKVETDFIEFIHKRYPKANNFEFKVLQASLNLSLNVGFKSNQFTGNIVSAIKKGNIYNVKMKDNSVYILKKIEKQWVMEFPPESIAQFKTLEPYLLAGKLKRLILVYRMLEAEIANLSLTKVKLNVSEDMAPIIIAMFGKERFPELTKWNKKDVNSILSFYGNFPNSQAMIAHIKKVHKL